MTSQQGLAPRVSTAAIAIAAMLGAAFLWSYWTTLERIAWFWSTDPQYSHGYLVPLFAVYLLWLRRDLLNAENIQRAWLGLGLLASAIGLRLAGSWFSYEYFDHISIVPCCAGLFLLAGGRSAFAWSWPAVAFLVFMVPLPHTVSHAMSRPLQTFATEVSTFALQVIGRPAISEGNVILINDIELNIVEACSGLRMLFVFFALSTAVALLIQKPLWEKLLIGASAVPIALAANVLRIAITGICYDSFGDKFGGAFFHDAAGWLMMPLGLVLLGIELWILKTLLIERSSDIALASQVSLQRVEVASLALYSEATPRRKKAEPESVEAVAQVE